MFSYTACPDKSGKSRLAGKTLMFLLLFFFPFFQIHAQVTIHVPADQPTIQAGIDAASDGDLVLVAHGTYIENINFNGKAITVASDFIIDEDESHIENTIIDGSQPSHPDTGSVVIFISGEDTTSVLCGFTITGGTGTRFSSAYRLGGGIYIYSASPIVKDNIVEDNLVSSNSDSWGSAIFAQTNFPNRTCIIENNIIRNNLSQPIGGSASGAGAVQCWYLSNSTIIIRNNFIYNNLVTGDYDIFGGGISAGAFANNDQYICIIESNKIVDNEVTDTPGSSTQWGGGIFIQDVNAIIRNNIIAYNSAEDGGGIYYYNSQTTPSVFPVIENNTIFGNTIAPGGYGGALNTNRYYNIINCIIWGNSSPQFYADYAVISYSNIEELYLNGTNNISLEPEFLDTTYFLLNDTSHCIDKGNPDPMYNDVEDPNNLGNPFWPSLGTLANDMGHFGGPNSLWCYWEWPLNFNLPSPPTLVFPGSSIDTTAVEFVWTMSTPLVTKYWFEVASDNQFTNSFIDSTIADTTYLYSSLNYGENYWWRIKAYNAMGWGEFSDVGSIVVVSVEGTENLPTEYGLKQNYPNPFNPNTKIRYSVPQSSNIIIKVFDILGNEIEILVNEEKPAGAYEITWYAENLPSGIYFYRLQANDFTQIRKMILLR